MRKRLLVFGHGPVDIFDPNSLKRRAAAFVATGHSRQMAGLESLGCHMRLRRCRGDQPRGFEMRIEVEWNFLGMKIIQRWK